MNEIELLALKIGQQTVKEMTGIGFLAWVAGKLNNTNAHNSTTQELLQAVKSPVIGRMADETKIEILRKLEKLNIQIP